MSAMNIGATSENPSFQKETVGIEACKAALVDISTTSYGRSISSGQDDQPSGGRHNRVWSRKKQPQNNRIALSGRVVWLRSRRFTNRALASAEGSATGEIDRAAVARNGGLSNRVCLAENGISPFAGFGGRRSFASVQAGLLNQHSQRQRPFARGNGFHDEEAFNCN